MIPSLTAVVEALEPVGLDAVNASAALQDRVDHKYVIPAGRLAVALAGSGAVYRVLEIDGLREFTYRTTYFDTEDLVTFRHHVQQRRRRFKARCREYVDTGLCGFEVKLKGLRGRTIKRRMDHEPPSGRWLSGSAAEFLAECLRREYGHPPPDAMRATLSMSYQRTTLVAEDLGERITIDTQLVFRSPGGSVGGMAAGLAIVESKSPDGRASIDNSLRMAGSRPESACSKYCLGMGLLHPGVRANPFRPLLRRHFSAHTLAAA